MKCVRVAVWLFTGLAVSGPALAETFEPYENSVAAIDSSARAPASAEPRFRGFESLSPGNQQIALALYYAQDLDGAPGRVWTMDRIAAEKARGAAWSEIHARLKRDGAMGEVSLGHILSRGVRANQPGKPAQREKARAAARAGLASLAPAATKGAFRSLSAGNRKIAEALFDIQTIGPQGKQAWSLDQIAAAKQGGANWTEILRQLREDGLVVERELGPIIAEHHRLESRRSGAGQLVVFDAAGRRTVMRDDN